ncbi:MAG: glycoside hydrolase family 3 C-terminal domain-containing protein [Deltaproteobacteria bacterium]
MLLRTVFFLFLMLLDILSFAQENQQAKFSYPYQDVNLSFETRAKDLVSRMSLAQKVGQLQHEAPAIESLGIQAYNWWNECLHGVARNGLATVFPQAIGMAATWNTELIRSQADIISTEARAKYYQALENGSTGIYQGLTFWSPNINIFRDPRWGRGQETYGEDPFLTAEIGKAFVHGLQGDDPKYLKVIATAKHFAVHSGPEPDRHSFDAWTSERDLFDTYLPAFEALVKESGVQSVMSAYNRVYGIPAPASDFLLKDILRKKWGFKGYVVSDCWAVSDIYGYHKFVPEVTKASSLSLKAGTDLTCGPEYGSLLKALDSGYIAENDIDTALVRLFTARMKLGMFDPPSMVPYSSIGKSQVDLPEHRKMALDVARESIVLLKNKDKILPLKSRIKTIAVIGPYAADTTVLLGNYNGSPSYMVPLLEGIKRGAGKNTKIIYTQGLYTPEKEINATQSEIEFLAEEVYKVAAKSDVVIFCGGISPVLEGEELKLEIDGFKGGDRTHLNLPVSQTNMIRKIKDMGKKLILVLTNGSALSIVEENDIADAVIEAWYPGQEGGNAVADVLFGKYNPAGRLPVTFYNSVNDIPAFEDYSMNNRTYRYFKGDVLYPFGYGLSYTDFEYMNMDCSVEENGDILVTTEIKNTGRFDGDEVVQIYLKQPHEISGQPVKSLAGFERIFIGKGEIKNVKIKIPSKQLRHYDPETGDYKISPGEYILMAGGSSADIKLIRKIKIDI